MEGQPVHEHVQRARRREGELARASLRVELAYRERLIGRRRPLHRGLGRLPVDLFGRPASA